MNEVSANILLFFQTNNFMTIFIFRVFLFSFAIQPLPLRKISQEFTLLDTKIYAKRW